MDLKSTKKLLIALAILFSYIGFSQQYAPFTVRYQDNLKGDLTFIGNNILNRAEGAWGPNDDYNNQNTNSSGRSWNRDPETGGYFNVNDRKDMRFINVDPANTFNSSSADFSFPQVNCNQIRYAGLYWSATYNSDF